MKNRRKSGVMRSHRTFFMLLGVVSGFVALRYRYPEYSLKVQSKIEIWRMELAKSFGLTKAAGLASRIRKRYFELMRQRPYFDSFVLRKHLEENILPGLALYQVLGEVLQEKERVQEWTTELMRISTIPQHFGYKLAGRLPLYYRLFSLILPGWMKVAYPAAGWKTEWLENNEQRVIFNFHSCFYMDVLQSYGAEELTPCFCRLFDEIASDISPHVCRLHDGMLTEGDAYCNFQYIYVDEDRILEPRFS